MITKLKNDFIVRSTVGALIIVIIASILFFIERFYENKNSEKIIAQSEFHINKAIERLAGSFHNLYRKDLLLMNQNQMTIEDLDLIDSLLKNISKNELSYFVGVEGGFYLNSSKKFLGFSFPTSPPPQPAYGPPPREYEIILKQIQQTSSQKNNLIKLYEFEPTVFILATKQIEIDGQKVATAYSLMRIEQILPVSFYKKFFPIVLFLSLTGISLAIYISWLLRRRVEQIKNGLNAIIENPNLRLQKQKGILGIISESINTLLDARDKEQTERIRLEKELQVKEKMASLGNLIAGVTHQIKTPLAIIKSKIQLWQKKIENDKTIKLNGIISKESMQDIVIEIDKLAGLVNRLLLFLKNPVQEFSESSINEIINKVISLLKTEAESKNIKIHFIENKNISARIDPSSIEQVIINLLVNAIQASDNNSEIIINTFQISADQIAIEIKDFGVGIDSQIIDKIFDPFFTTKKEGYGLGLSIAYEIVKLHKGSISVFPNEPKGTTFRIILPIS